MASEKSPVKKRRIKDSEEQKKPALRISHIAYGRERRGNRVVYLVDPTGAGEEKRLRSRLFSTAGDVALFLGTALREVV